MHIPDAMDGVQPKQEVIEQVNTPNPDRNSAPSKPISVIDLSSSGSDSDDPSSASDDESALRNNGKRSRSSKGAKGDFSRKGTKKMKKLGVSLMPLGFLDRLPPNTASFPPSLPLSAATKHQSSANESANVTANATGQTCKQFWRAGDFVGAPGGDWDTSSGGMDHIRVHPKFLHSNATSHKWVLGAFAELLDNALDEVFNGATFVKIDMLKNKKDGSRMLLIEDNGGGMDPDKMRQCMSLGYSVKSKLADTIGQYGNGFKTSTMRLGADVIVFSRCCGQQGNRGSTQCIGLLSYTFLRSTKKEEILVPMLDYEGGGLEWNRMVRSSASDWNTNVETIVQWSPFSNEADLLQQFNHMKDHGTRIIIYNLWEDDQGQLELDFDADPLDVQIRGVNRDEKKMQMAKQFPNSKHFLTYQHSLRSYASILYLRMPPGFRVILRGKDVEHHNVVNDMMMTQETTYRPQPGIDAVPKDYDMVAVVNIGFVKDARFHIDVQGYNVYHKNRLIKPFWRVWNPAGSYGRGVIGVLEANFVEPAHDKQGFERTIVLSRLEAKLQQIQKRYWYTQRHKIGYWSYRNNVICNEETPPGFLPRTPSQSGKKDTGLSSKIPISVSGKLPSQVNQDLVRETERYLKTVGKSHSNGNLYYKGGDRTKTPAKSGKGPCSAQSPSEEDVSDNEGDDVCGAELSPTNRNPLSLHQLKEENRQLRERLCRMDEEVSGDFLRELQFERERRNLLENKFVETTRKIDELQKEHESMIYSFQEERKSRTDEEESLRKKLKDVSSTIPALLDKVRLLERM